MSTGATLRHGLPAHSVRQIRQVLARHPNVVGVALYGSRAMGNHRPGSDIDLCLDAPSLTLAEFFAIGTEIDDLLLPWKVDLTVLQKIDNPALIEHIRRVGMPFDDCAA